MEPWTVKILLPLLIGTALGAVAWLSGTVAGRRTRDSALEEAERHLEQTREQAGALRRKLISAAESSRDELLEEAEKRDQEVEQREAEIDRRMRDQEQKSQRLNKQISEQKAASERIARREEETQKAHDRTIELRDETEAKLREVAGMTPDEARDQLVARVESAARLDAARLTRKIIDEARETATRESTRHVLQAMERMPLREAVENTINFIQLSSDEMKGRIIGREGRNIRAIENTTGIDLIIDDTPGAILLSSFDPIRREIARVALERLIEDGRIHPARIEEVVQKVREEFDTLVEDGGNQAAFRLGISDLHPKLARLVGRLKFRSNYGQNLLQHSMEVGFIATFLADELGLDSDVVRHAALLHEIGRVDPATQGHTVLASAELAGKYGESAEVSEAIQSLHPDVDTSSAASMVLRIANRISDNRPGARKDNLEIFIERLTRLEEIAKSFDGVEDAIAVKAGKELRVIVRSDMLADADVLDLSKALARKVERELEFPGQIKISVVRETRAVQFAL